MVFDALQDWSKRREGGIRYYSGSAVYKKSFTLPEGQPQPQDRLWLDLGNIRELAEIRLNGKSLGIVWAPPFQVEITSALKPGMNELSVDVVNFWPNRIIGDASLPELERRTRTNIRKLTPETKLMDSGLLGPVRLLREMKGTSAVLPTRR